MALPSVGSKMGEPGVDQQNPSELPGVGEGGRRSAALRSKRKGKGGFRETGSQAKALGQKSAWEAVRRAPEQKVATRN